MNALKMRWARLNEKANEIASMADLAEEPLQTTQLELGQATETSFDTVLSGLEDMELLVEIGLKALREVEAREQDPSAPALTLWREVYHAREAVRNALDPVAA